MTLVEFNDLPAALAHQQLANCCAATTWVERMLRLRPFHSVAALTEAAATSWQNLAEADYLEAFAAHPRIGDLTSLQKKFAHTAQMAGREQGGIGDADEATLLQLQQLNDDYFARFGFIFIVFASGKSASAMLSLLSARIHNSRAAEITHAAAEQQKITALRLSRLITTART